MLWAQLQSRFASSNAPGLKAYKPTSPGEPCASLDCVL